MKSSKNKTVRKGIIHPSLLSSYLVEASGVFDEDKDKAFRADAAHGKQLVQGVVESFSAKKNVKTPFNNFGLFIEMLRRRDGLTREELAKKANIDLSEVNDIETLDEMDVLPRTLYQLERCFNLKENVLAKLSGAVRTLKGDVQQNIVKYAAQAKHANRLNDEELQILNEVIAMLGKES